MPDEQITDDQIGRFAMTAIDRVLNVAEAVAASYIAKLDREATSDSVLPGEYPDEPAPPQAPVALRAKVRCTLVTSGNVHGDMTPGYVNVALNAVSAEGSDNASWTAATPSGSVSLCITNPGAFDSLVQGMDYYLDLTAVPLVPASQTASVPDATAADSAPRGTYAEPASPSAPTPPSA